MDSLAHGVKRGMRPASASQEPPEDLSILTDVPFIIEAEMGRTQRTFRDVLKYNQGSLIEFDKEEDTPIELRINGRLIAKGEIVEIDGNYGVRILELVYQ